MSVATAVFAADEREWRFQVYLDNKPIGYHRFEVKKRNNVTEVDSAADFKVKFLFITAYRYIHKNQEIWHQDCLRTLRSNTDDNGKEFAVSGWQEDADFVIQTRQGQASAPTCVMSFAYWNPAILEQFQLLNPQTGEVLPVTVQDLGHRPVEVGSLTVDGRCFDLNAKTKRINVCYDDVGRWLALTSETKDGRRIDYRLTDWPEKADS